MDAYERQNRICGCFMGLAAGDAMGMPTRGMRPYDVLRKYQYIDGFYGGRNPDGSETPPGTYTGVTQLALTNCVNLFSGGDPMDQMALPRMLADLRSKGKSRWEPFSKEGQSDHAEFVSSCIPIGLLASAEPIEAKAVLSKCKATTAKMARGRMSVLAAFAASWTVGELVRGQSSTDGLSDLYLSRESLMARLISTVSQVEDHIEKTEVVDDRLSVRLGYVKSQVERGVSVEEFVGMNGNSWKCMESVPAAFFFFLKAPDDITSVRKAATMGGASSLVAGLCGAMIGASCGMGFLPESERESIEGHAKIMQAATKLASMATQ